jgi:hypothetical protein
MSEIVLRRIPSRIIACFDVSQWERGDISRGLRDKSADVRRADMAGRVEEVGPRIKSLADNFPETPTKSTFPAPSLFPVHGEHDETARR